MLLGDSKKGETRSLRKERALPALAQPPAMGAGPSSGRRTRVADTSNQAPPQPGQGSNSNASRSASVQSVRNPSASIRLNANAASSPPSNASAKSLQGDSSRRRLPVLPPTTQHAHNVAPQTRRDDVALTTQQQAPTGIRIEVPNQHDGARQDSVSSFSSGPSISTLDALYPLDTDQIITWSLADAATAPRSYYTASKSTSGELVRLGAGAVHSDVTISLVAWLVLEWALFQQVASESRTSLLYPRFSPHKTSMRTDY